MPTVHDDASATLDSVTGINGVQRGGTGANLSATSGYLHQATAGAAVVPVTAAALIADALPTTTKGDIIVRNASANTRLAIGADGSSMMPDSTQATGIRWFAAPVLNVKAPPYLAAGDGVTDDTAAIQAAIDDAAAGGFNVYIPAVTNPAHYYNIASTLTITTGGVRLIGGGVYAIIYKGTAGDALQIGDNVTQISDVVIDGVNFNGVDASGWSINARKAPNTIIQNCIFANSSTASGAISMDSSWNSRIVNNTVGSLKGTAIKLTNSTNSIPITGNRIDGNGGGSSTAVGMYLSGTTLYVSGNTIEGVNVGIDIVACSTISIIGNYFENNSLGTTPVDIRTAAGGVTTGLTIASNYFAPDAIAYSIDLDLVRGVYIGPNTFAPTTPYTSGYPILIDSNAQKVRLDANEQWIDEDNEDSAATGAGINGMPVRASNTLTGDMTSTRNIMKVHYPGGVVKLRVTYHLVADGTDQDAGTRDETFGVTTVVAKMSSLGVWGVISAFTAEITERTLGTAAVPTFGLANGDASGGHITMSATNYSGANARAIFAVEATGLDDGLPTMSRP